MRNILNIFTCFHFASCTKEWKCDLTGTTVIYGVTYAIDSHPTFFGTKKEMKNYEEINTVSNGSTTAVMECH